MFLFHHSAKTVNITMLTLSNNIGQLLIIEPLEVSGIQQYLQVNLLNSSLSNNSASQALIHISKGSQLAVTNSLFKENYSIGRASVIFTEKDNARVNIVSSNFSQNYALYGGVFFSQLNGFISCEKCIFQNNFALYGGVLYSQNEGQAVFKSCLLTNNAAMRASLIYSINSQSNIIIDGGTITQNKMWDQKDIFDLLLFKNKTRSYQLLSRNFSLPFIKGLEYNLKEIIVIATASAITATGSNSGTSNQYFSANFQIQAIKSTIMMLGMVKVIDQEQLLQAQSASVIRISNLTVQDVNTQESMLEFDQAQFQINGLIMSNINTTSPLVTLNSDSIGIISRLDAEKIDGPIIFSDTCNFTISDIQLKLIKSQQGKYAIMDFRKTILVLQGAMFENISMIETGGGASAIISLGENSRAIIDRLKVKKFNSVLLKVSSSYLELQNSEFYEGNNLQKYTQQTGLALIIIKSSAELQNCTFAHLSSRVGPAINGWDSPESNNLNNISVINSTFYANYAVHSGGAVIIQDVSFYTERSQYQFNIAELGDGGALFLSWSMENKKKAFFEALLNSFQSNSANNKGGGIYYDLFSPSQLMNNIFKNNDAQYGKDYASYPFQLRLISESKSAIIPLSTSAGGIQQINIQLNSSMMIQTRTEYSSGEQLKRNLIVGIYDQNDQIVSTDSHSEGILSSVDIKLIISGNNKVIAKNGVFNFSNLKFIAQPDYNSSIKFTSDALDKQKIEKVSASLQQDLTDYIYFRKCFSGEAIVNNQCQSCTKGFYSFSMMTKGCKKCFLNGVCNGGNLVGVQKGFYRTSNISEKAYQCPELSSCKGGTNISDQCSFGYSGRMCNTCLKEEINGTFYARTSTYRCQACSSLGVQLLIMLLFFIGFGLYLTYLLYSLIQNPSRNKPQTVLLRIITNYSQAIMIVYEFDLNWPIQVKNALTYFSFIQTSQEYVFSTDCIAKLMGFEIKTSMFYIKVIVYGLMPLIATLIAGFVWFIIYMVKYYRNGVVVDIKQNIRVTFFIIVFLLYPSITNLSFSLFDCFTLDDNLSYLRRDFEIKCTTNQHLKMALSIGIPFILVWVIAFPVYIFQKLKSLRRNFNDKDVITSYGLFFIGLHDNAYFWEVVVTNARKLIFIICSTLFSSSSAVIKALIGAMVLFLQMQLLHYYNPYIDPRFNTIEHLAIYASIFTVFAGLFFLESETQTNNYTKITLFLLVLCFNVCFLCKWLYRICDVTFRTQVSLSRSWLCCRFLRRMEVNDYEKDLSIVLQLVKEQNLHSKRFFISRTKSGKQLSSDEQFNKIDNDVSCRSSQFNSFQKLKKSRSIQELRKGKNDQDSWDEKDWGAGDHQNNSSSQNLSLSFGHYPRKLEPQPLLVDNMHLAMKRMSGNYHRRESKFNQDLNGEGRLRNTKKSVGFIDKTKCDLMVGFNYGEEQQDDSSISSHHYQRQYRQYRGRYYDNKKLNVIQDDQACKQTLVDRSRMDQIFLDESQDKSFHFSSSSQASFPAKNNQAISQTSHFNELKNLQAPSTLKNISHQKQKQKSQIPHARNLITKYASKQNPNHVSILASEVKLGMASQQTGWRKDTPLKKQVLAIQEASERITSESEQSSSQSSQPKLEIPSGNSQNLGMPSDNKIQKQNKKESSLTTQNHLQGKHHESNKPVGELKTDSELSKSPFKQGPHKKSKMGLWFQ